MTTFGSIWLIALAWCFLQGSITLGNLILGGFLSALVFIFSLSFNGMDKNWNTLQAGIRLIFFVLWELVISSLRLAWDILTPTVYARPRVIRIPIGDMNDIAITVLANAISLTPGSLALEVSHNRQYLYVHVMYAEDQEATVKNIYYDLGNRVRAACGIQELVP